MNNESPKSYVVPAAPISPSHARRQTFEDPNRKRNSSVASVLNYLRGNSAVAELPHVNNISQLVLNTLNIEQDKATNKQNLDNLGGVEGLAKALDINLEYGLKPDQVTILSTAFGYNEFPKAPQKYFFMMLLDAFSDRVLLVLIAAAIVSLIIGVYQSPDHGYIEAVAIFIAIILVALISTFNDYTKELQFRALEQSSQQDEKTTVIRDGVAKLIKTNEIVVGDIVKLQTGDMVPADCIIIESHAVAMCNQSALTGEPEDIRKTKSGDPFMLSSCLVTECNNDVKAFVTGIGLHSQWGKIKSNLVVESVNTPLQEKLADMTTLIGYIGIVFAIATFIALVVQIWTHHKPVAKGLIDAFILAVTIIVVAIPEGLPLAVAISLAYSTKKMYKDNCFIRVLAACETMGNATNICSDKTGTLTQNRMTVVQGWFGDYFYNEKEFLFNHQEIHENVKKIITENASINRTAYYVNDKAVTTVSSAPDDRSVLIKSPQNSSNMTTNTSQKNASSPSRTSGRNDMFKMEISRRDLNNTSAVIVGNKTEASLMMMVASWGADCDWIKKGMFSPGRDKIYPFDSTKKRSSAIIQRADGSIRLYCKGASESVLKDCTTYMDKHGRIMDMDNYKIKELEDLIKNMANDALRTLVLAHKDYRNINEMPPNWQNIPPDNSDLCCDCIVGIIDPIRNDVVQAVATAQQAGVIVRMVTGDNVNTAAAIARQCGILKEGDICLEGPTFRALSPSRLDEILPKLRVLARSSPDDKRLLVTRLNGANLPTCKEEWEETHKFRTPHVTWDLDRNNVLPGYREEWTERRPNGGDVVGVTGDGTNDAPALKAADVGLSMGITGTKVAQEASDIVLLDDRFSSIVNAIKWGRCVYDNIRKFLQFQLTVNIVALILVFIGAVVGFGQPLNAVMMLWVNLVMDTFGALALGTEMPTDKLLKRLPYKRSASLISRPMWRNIIVMAMFQLTLLFILLFLGPSLFHVLPNETCIRYKNPESKSGRWSVISHDRVDDSVTQDTVQCTDFKIYCPKKDYNCYTSSILYNNTYSFTFADLDKFEERCLTCEKADYTHGTIIFNAFIFCQIFNEYVARKFDEVNMFDGIQNSPMFLLVSIFSIGAQIFLVELGGEFVKTSPLTIYQWLITVALGAIALPVGMLMRFIPVEEDPDTFFDAGTHDIENHELRIKPKKKGFLSKFTPSAMYSAVYSTNVNSDFTPSSSPDSKD